MVVGLGAIGLSCARAIACEPSLELVAVIDTDTEKAGKSIVELSGGAACGQTDLCALSHIDDALAVKPQVAVVCTTSRFDQIAPLLRDLLDRGLAVVSSCEQMLYPWYRHAQLADDIDNAARAAGRAVLGTGVNPGFVMDYLPVVLASVVRRVTAVRCLRRVDASLRRAALQAKVGAGLSEKTFRARAAKGAIGHAGLAESLALLAAGLAHRVEPDSIEESLEPVLADRKLPWARGTIEPGQVTGVHHLAAWSAPDLSVTLDLTMAVGIDNPRDVVCIDGPVPVKLKIPGSVPGDSATVAALLNHIPIVHRAAPGLRTMIDLPPAGCIHRSRV